MPKLREYKNLHLLILSFAFCGSLVFFGVLRKEPENACYLLVSAHLFYNILVQLVFSP